MAATTAGHARASFEFKSATLPLVALLLRTPDPEALAQAFSQQFGDTPEFFDGDAVVIDLGHLAGDAAIDFPALIALLRRYHTLPVAVRGGSAAQHAAARAAGLAEAAEEPAVATREVEVEVVREVPVQVPVEVPVAGPGTLVVDKPLRSGQQVYARGGDLVVLAVVSFGAEVIADGNIHVYAPLRGRALAGARGNADARIFSTCLEPQLVSIAGIYRTSEKAFPADIVGKPAQVRLEGEKLIVEAL
ncbi:septum site-determining protein MinC [Ramlibacter sp. H39-3-26]|uniref:septum site-determining protein MinC n=1 Tax=Curvibacter soli TaxID=3031331 RepID=UPI0023DC272D|nr:septum site-determining protein MinC [Ramlibacter sp. H39-3-26]MDF1484901.1 septum site-determining protein MinC [Ramlibacter sp. H39-3-26]